MKKQKLNYIFHNPNTVEATAKYLLDILIEANEGKIERAIQEMDEKIEEEQLDVEECLA